MDTRAVQTRLATLGFLPAAEIDGFDGPITDAAIRAFQKKAGLHVDGIVGPKTEAALKAADIPPVGARKTSPAGVKALADREGRRLTAYRDTKGVWTVGLGHTSMAGPPTVYEGLTITGAQCDEIFARDIAKYEATVNEAIKRPIGQNAFDACVSLCYNIGQGGFAGSTVVKRINSGDMYGAAEAFMMWDIPYEIFDRRNSERLQFLKDLAPPMPLSLNTSATAAAPLPPDVEAPDLVAVPGSPTLLPPDVLAPYDKPLPGEPGYEPPEKPGLHTVAFWTSVAGIAAAGVVLGGRALGWW